MWSPYRFGRFAPRKRSGSGSPGRSSAPGGIGNRREERGSLGRPRASRTLVAVDRFARPPWRIVGAQGPADRPVSGQRFQIGRDRTDVAIGHVELARPISSAIVRWRRSAVMARPHIGGDVVGRTMAEPAPAVVGEMSGANHPCSGRPEGIGWSCRPPGRISGVTGAAMTWPIDQKSSRLHAGLFAGRACIRPRGNRERPHAHPPPGY